MATCQNCNFEFFDEGDYSYCSEFCAVGGEGDWKTAKEGDFILYPCGICGCAIEGAFSTPRVCGGCSDRYRLMKLLRDTLEHLPDGKLRTDVRSVVEGFRWPE